MKLTKRPEDRALEAERETEGWQYLYSRELERRKEVERQAQALRDEVRGLKSVLRIVLGLARKGDYNPGHRGLLKQIKSKAGEALREKLEGVR